MIGLNGAKGTNITTVLRGTDLSSKTHVTLEYEESQIKSKLYQGTEYEVDVVFDGYKFATKNSDSNNHYVMKRTTASEVDLGTNYTSQ